MANTAPEASLWSSTQGKISVRRRVGAWVLTLVAWLSLIRLRSTGESMVYLGIDSLGTLGCLCGLWWLANRPTSRRSFRRMLVAGIGALLFPIAWGMVWRSYSLGAAWEMLSLAILSVISGLLALVGRRRSHVDLSVAASGFVALFTTAISDQRIAVVIALVWVVLCLWWLVANHWERLEVALVRDVRRRRPRTSLTVSLATGLSLFAGSVMFGRGPATRLLEWGLSPFSGGSRESDANARAGVGDGEMLVAAQKHATSFGAVETDVFLESRHPSLFDLANDAYGSPFKKQRNEKAIALQGKMEQMKESKIAKSEQNSQTFTTSRSAPLPKKRLEDRTTSALAFWVGRSGIRLAMQRYNQFDGIDWTWEGGEATIPSWSSMVFGDRHWFFKSPERHHPLLVGAIPEALKVMHLGSPRIPTPDSLAGWHIDRVDRSDFFGLTADQSLELAGRERVPELTVLRMVSREIDRDELEKLSEDGSWERIEAIIDELRSTYILDRQQALDQENPLQDLLKHKRGPEYLFATAACLKIRELGKQARLVTGLYVRPERFDPLAMQASLLSEDLHTWAEVEVAPGIWLPVEPSPGYEPPRYHLSWWYRTKRLARWAFPVVTIVGVVAACLWRVRKIWLGWVCTLLWQMEKFIPKRSPRRRIAMLVYFLDLRCHWARCPRPKGTLPVNWYTKLGSAADEGLATTIRQLFRLADRVRFGDGVTDPGILYQLSETVFRKFHLPRDFSLLSRGSGRSVESLRIRSRSTSSTINR